MVAKIILLISLLILLLLDSSCSSSTYCNDLVDCSKWGELPVCGANGSGQTRVFRNFCELLNASCKENFDIRMSECKTTEKAIAKIKKRVK